MVWLGIGIYIAAAIGAFICFLLLHRARSDARKYRSAAERMIREEILDYSLKNPYTLPKGTSMPATKRLMLGICMKHGDSKQRLLFDPAKPIYIGRSRHNQIIIQGKEISAQHTCIFIHHGKVWIRDLHSYSGTVIFRGWTKRKTIPRGKTIRLLDGDRIQIQDYMFSVYIFGFDLNRR